jgi:hypothetical protein
MTAIIVDVSAAQETITPAQWKAAAADGLAGAIVNLGTGETHASPTAQLHCDGVRGAGLPVGPYHVCTPSLAEGDALREAEKFVARREKHGPFTLKSSLDVEDAEALTPDQLALWCITWGENVAGGKHLLYCNKSVCRHLGRCNTRLLLRLAALFDLWLAGDNSSTPSPSPWARPALWQTPRRRVSWTREDIDINEAPEGVAPLLAVAPASSTEDIGTLIGVLEGALGMARRLRGAR